MFLFAIICILSGVHSHYLLREQWEVFKMEHNKNYDTPEEEEYRLSVYRDNLEIIANHNKLYRMGLSTYTMGMNQFGDLTQEEYQYFYQMPYASNLPEDIDEDIWLPGSHHAHVSRPLPKRIDWRLIGAVTGVKSQGKCASCYAFSALASLESQHYLATNRLVSLSEQNIVDCTKAYKNKGCLGGCVDATFKYIIKNGGVDTASSYPYRAARNKLCLFNRTNIGATMKKFVLIKKGNETDLQRAVAFVGPVSVMVDGNGLQFYSGGLYNNPHCSSTRYSHGMTVVGYGTYAKVDYWLVKNSHGVGWGERGYIMMSRNKGNQCAIAQNALYPLV